MRSAHRIREVLDAVEAHWLRAPDMRLTQLILAAGGIGEPAEFLGHVEDDALEAGLRFLAVVWGQEVSAEEAGEATAPKYRRTQILAACSDLTQAALAVHGSVLAQSSDAERLKRSEAEPVREAIRLASAALWNVSALLHGVGYITTTGPVAATRRAMDDTKAAHEAANLKIG